ncbi:MAG: thiamine pyrophosphate-dependent dehydrogenase E1 component subunit alpha [Deltaproteobacteria bacterium]|nr:thiamine pyrophosphate-dependent dehydrogenase E1 component subunit alpha [Deltaproteobacteria bacterium]
MAELVVPKLEIPKDTLVGMYQLLLRSRIFEDKILYICSNQTPQNPFITGKGYLSTGQEAISVGCAFALRPTDWFAQSHRDLAAHFHRGVSPLKLLLQYRCTAGSPTQGKDGNMHFVVPDTRMVGFTSHMGQNAAVAVGLAWAAKYKGEDGVVLTSFGEGASQQGIVHESMNYAAVFQLPLVFVINNNRWAISVPVKEQMLIEDLAERGPAYGIPSVIVDGNDVIAVYAACVAAVARAREEKGPSLIECKSMRMTGHGTHDPATYVPKEEKEAWAKKDPILRMQRYLLERKIMTESDDKKWRAEIAAQIEQAVDDAAEDGPPDPAIALVGTVSTPTPVE